MKVELNSNIYEDATEMNQSLFAATAGREK
jgi:hypothetical protein